LADFDPWGELDDDGLRNRFDGDPVKPDEPL
jgi:hypothetical protein